MNIVRRDPFDMPVTAMNRLMNQLWNDRFFQDGGGMDELMLPIDVLEDDRTVTVKASVPGFKPDEIDIQIHSGILTIKAEHTEESEEKEGRYLHRERRWGSLTRSVALPSTVDEDHCDADLTSGVLTLSIPKSEKAMPRKIKVGGGQQSGKPEVTSKGNTSRST